MKLPKIDAFRDNVKIVEKPGAPPPTPSKIDPEVQKKRQEAIKRISEKAAEIERALNGGDYKRAFKLAMGELEKYTAQSIKGNELLERVASMAETALEYMNSLLPVKEDDWFLDVLCGEMDNYKATPLFQAIERVLAERLKKKLAQFKKEGKEGWIPAWLETWAPVVELIDTQKVLNKYLAGEPDAQLRWKFKIPVQYAPGEKQRLGEKRRKIHEAMAAKAAEIEKDTVSTRPPPPSEPEAIFVPVIADAPRIPKASGASGAFSRKKATTSEQAKPAPPPKAHKPHPKQAKPKPLAALDDHISTTEVKEYLFKLKHEQNINDVHFIKIKNDLNAISLNKEKKLFKILMRLVEKGIVIKKTGSIFAIVF